MELALLPIAAILLLLSGVSAPAHAAMERATTAALMRELFGYQNVSALRPEYQAAGRTIARQVQDGDRSAGLLRREAADLVAAQPLQSPAAAFARKQFRTRFGFAEGAYLAQGPPCRTPRTEPHWLYRA